MKIVRMEGNTVVEILPEETYKLGISYWYGEEFAKNCIETEQDICQGDIYDIETRTFSKPIIKDEGKEIEIKILKDELSSTDYKVIKCVECSLAGSELPYDIKALNEERQSLRDRINELELIAD